MRGGTRAVRCRDDAGLRLANTPGIVGAYRVLKLMSSSLKCVAFFCSCSLHSVRHPTYPDVETTQDFPLRHPTSYIYQHTQFAAMRSRDTSHAPRRANVQIVIEHGRRHGDRPTSRLIERDKETGPGTLSTDESTVFSRTRRNIWTQPGVEGADEPHGPATNCVEPCSS